MTDFTCPEPGLRRGVYLPETPAEAALQPFQSRRTRLAWET